MTEVDTLQTTSPDAQKPAEELDSHIKYVSYETEEQMQDIIQMVQKDLSEPYTIYTYRYFIYNWGHLCFLAYDDKKCVGAIVCKLESCKAESQPGDTNEGVNKGYIAMLVVEEEYRKKKIGSKLVKMAVNAMKEAKADEIVLETTVTNKPALKLYENLGFLRDKRMFRYYLNGLDALRLKLWLR